MTEPTLAPSDRGVERPRGSERPLSEAYDAALLDLDGVVYLGGAAVPGAADALAEAKRRGMRLAFVTNNASRLAVGDHRAAHQPGRGRRPRPTW